MKDLGFGRCNLKPHWAFLLGLVGVAEGLVPVLTFGLYGVPWGVHFTFWLALRKPDGISYRRKK